MVPWPPPLPPRIPSPTSNHLPAYGGCEGVGRWLCAVDCVAGSAAYWGRCWSCSSACFALVDLEHDRCTYTHTRTHTHTHTRTRTHAHTNTHTHARTHTRTHERTHARTHARQTRVTAYAIVQVRSILNDCREKTKVMFHIGGKVEEKKKVINVELLNKRRHNYGLTSYFLCTNVYQLNVPIHSSFIIILIHH